MRDIRVDGDAETAQLSCGVVADGADLPSRLWFRFPGDLAPLIDPSRSAFVPILLLVAMRLQRDLHVEAAVSPELLWSVRRLMAIYAEWSADFVPLSEVDVTAAGAGVSPRGTSAASFFSCGVDSSFTLLRNVNRYPPGDSRALSHLLMVHGFDVPLSDQMFFGAIYERAQRIADTYGKRLVRIVTNAREGRFDCVDFQHYGHGPSLASVGLALGRGFHTFYIPSTDPALQLEPWGSHPAVDPLWSTETVEFVHDGLEARRLDKMISVARVPLFLDTLRVCMVARSGVYNCAQCSKCLRAMTELELIGVLRQCRTFPRLDLGLVTNLSIPDRRARDLWVHTRNYARDLGRPEVVAAVETALARFEREEYKWMAPVANVLAAIGVTPDRLRSLKRRVVGPRERFQGHPRESEP